jgi:hypothetical protein
MSPPTGHAPNRLTLGTVPRSEQAVCDYFEHGTAEKRDELTSQTRRFRSSSKSGAIALTALTLGAKAAESRRSNRCTYSITSLARASSVVGTSRPSALAVLRLITISYLVGACTGRSAGFSPLRMRST